VRCKPTGRHATRLAIQRDVLSKSFEQTYYLMKQLAEPPPYPIPRITYPTPRPRRESGTEIGYDQNDDNQDDELLIQTGQDTRQRA